MRATVSSRVLSVGCAIWLLGSLAAPAGDACTVCASDNGAEVRRLLAADDDFTLNLVAAVLPSVVCFGIVAAIHFGLPMRRSGAGRGVREV